MATVVAASSWSLHHRFSRWPFSPRWRRFPLRGQFEPGSYPWRPSKASAPRLYSNNIVYSRQSLLRDRWHPRHHNQVFWPHCRQGRSSVETPEHSSDPLLWDGPYTQNDLLVPPKSYVKFLNVEILKMSWYCPSPTGNQAPHRKRKPRRVSGEEHLTWSHGPFKPCFYHLLAVWLWPIWLACSLLCWQWALILNTWWMKYREK